MIVTDDASHDLVALNEALESLAAMQVSGDTVMLNQGTIYPALVRLEEQGWISSEWGTSENNRRARFYSLTTAGRKQLKDEVANWQRVATLVNTVLAAD